MPKAPQAPQAPQAEGLPAVLVPVDFSERSRAAALFAAELIGSSPVSLRILHVLHESGDQAGFYRKHDGAGPGRPLRDVARDMLDGLVAELRSEHPGLNALQHASTLLVDGIPSSRIVEIAEREKPIMIVMGSHGRVGIRRLLNGSVAEHVVQQSLHPVVVVKDTDPESLHSTQLKTLHRPLVQRALDGAPGIR